MLQVMKENCTIAKPHLVENFIQDLMSEHTEKDENVSFTRVRRVFVCIDTFNPLGEALTLS